MVTEKEKLTVGINGYVRSWAGKLRFDKDEENLIAFKGSYEWVAKQAVKAFKEDNGIE